MKKYAPMFAAASVLAAPALVTSATRAEAIQYPVCLSYVEGWSGIVERCEFTSIQQCQWSAQGLSGSCYANWRYAYAQPVPVEPPMKRRTRRAY